MKFKKLILSTFVVAIFFNISNRNARSDYEEEKEIANGIASIFLQTEDPDEIEFGREKISPRGGKFQLNVNKSLWDEPDFELKLEYIQNEDRENEKPHVDLNWE